MHNFCHSASHSCPLPFFLFILISSQSRQQWSLIMEKSCSVATLPEISAEIIKLNGNGCSRSAGDQLLIRKLFDWLDPQWKNSLSDFSNIQKLAVLFVHRRRTIEKITTPEIISLKHVWETLVSQVCIYKPNSHHQECSSGLLLGLMFYLVSVWCTIGPFNLLVVVSLALGKQKFHTYYKNCSKSEIALLIWIVLCSELWM